MPIEIISPDQAHAAISAGAQLVDIRDPGEHAREKIAGAINLPLVRIRELRQGETPVIFHCRSGMRTAANATELASAAGSSRAYILDGGIDAWRRAEYPTIVDRSQPLDIMRQVQITAGTLVLAGVLLGLLVTPVFFGLSAFVGAGLVVAGTTGWCGMAGVLQRMPWNRSATA